MRWVLILVAIAGVVGAFLVRTPGLLGLCLLVIFIGAIGAVFAFAHARIEVNARSETLDAVDVVAFKSALPAQTTAARDQRTTPS